MSELILVCVYNITFSEFFFSDWLMYEIRCLVKSQSISFMHKNSLKKQTLVYCEKKILVHIETSK